MGRTPHLTLLPGALDELLGPAMPNASCKGHAPLHDDVIAGESTKQREERHARAVQICTSCPALDACRAVLADLDVTVLGVWAGEVRMQVTRSEYQRAWRRRRAEHSRSA